MSDPADLTAPLDPAAYRPRRAARSPWFIAGFGLACLGAGAALGVGGLKFAGRAPKPAAALPAVASPAPSAPIAPFPSALQIPEPPAGPALGDIEARLSRLEKQERLDARAAAQALAAAALVEAAQGSRPFPGEVAAARAAAPAAFELTQLAQLAVEGAPSRAALAAGFSTYAATAASAIHAPKDGDGLGARLVHALSKIVAIRRVGPVDGDGPDALLARAELHIADGDLERALPLLDRLPASARAALQPWRLRAERRIQIDQALAGLRLRALEAVGAAARDDT
jgi:hypothetical protein